jgi:hypothetical protein
VMGDCLCLSCNAVHDARSCLRPGRVTEAYEAVSHVVRKNVPVAIAPSIEHELKLKCAQFIFFRSRKEAQKKRFTLSQLHV